MNVIINNIIILVGICSFIPLNFSRGVDCILSKLIISLPTPVQSLTPYHAFKKVRYLACGLPNSYYFSYTQVLLLARYQFLDNP